MVIVDDTKIETVYILRWLIHRMINRCERRSLHYRVRKAVELFRGLYARVGQKLRLDPSFVSRVARGERKSEAVERELNKEFRRVVKLIRMKSFTAPDKNR